MAEDKWTCKDCFKRKGEIVQLELMHLNFHEALYMCTQEGCTFPFSGTQFILPDYLVANDLLSDSDSDEEDVISENEFSEELKNYLARHCHSVENQVNGFNSNPLLKDVDHHTDDSKQDLDYPTIPNSECILENFNIDQSKNSEFSSVDYERDFKSLVSELAAYSETACTSESNASACEPETSENSGEPEINENYQFCAISSQDKIDCEVENDSSQFPNTDECEKMSVEENGGDISPAFNAHKFENALAEEPKSAILQCFQIKDCSVVLTSPRIEDLSYWQKCSSNGQINLDKSSELKLHGLHSFSHMTEHDYVAEKKEACSQDFPNSGRSKQTCDKPEDNSSMKNENDVHTTICKPGTGVSVKLPETTVRPKRSVRAKKRHFEDFYYY